MTLQDHAIFFSVYLSINKKNMCALRSHCSNFCLKCVIKDFCQCILHDRIYHEIKLKYCHFKRKNYWIWPQSSKLTTAAFWRRFNHEGKISPGWWGWGVHAHPLSLLLPSPVKLQCTLQLSGQTHYPPCYISSKSMYSVDMAVEKR